MHPCGVGDGGTGHHPGGEFYVELHTDLAARWQIEAREGPRQFAHPVDIGAARNRRIARVTLDLGVLHRGWLGIASRQHVIDGVGRHSADSWHCREVGRERIDDHRIHHWRGAGVGGGEVERRRVPWTEPTVGTLVEAQPRRALDHIETRRYRRDREGGARRLQCRFPRAGDGVFHCVRDGHTRGGQGFPDGGVEADVGIGTRLAVGHVVAGQDVVAARAVGECNPDALDLSGHHPTRQTGLIAGGGRAVTEDTCRTVRGTRAHIHLHPVGTLREVHIDVGRESYRVEEISVRVGDDELLEIHVAAVGSGVHPLPNLDCLRRQSDGGSGHHPRHDQFLQCSVVARVSHLHCW